MSPAGPRLLSTTASPVLRRESSYPLSWYARTAAPAKGTRKTAHSPTSSHVHSRSIHVSGTCGLYPRSAARANAIASNLLRTLDEFKAIQLAESTLGRSYLYVPATSERMLDKSLTTPSDVIIYDLEDSVPPSPADKNGARDRLAQFFSNRLADLPSLHRVAVRVNSLATPFFEEDIKQAIRIRSVRTLVLPKVHSASDLDRISEAVYGAFKSLKNPDRQPVEFVASIESARAMFELGAIAKWQTPLEPRYGGKLSALLFAAEDYCADTGIIRTTSRQELLYTRSHIAVTAKAFKLKAIDMVCVNYKDLDYLREECEDGRRLGFTGKQAIHPSQVDVIQSTFVPSAKEILRAARILKQMEKAHQSNKGAAGLALEGGGMEMIDAPMIKQAENVVRAAKAAGLEIPNVE